MILHDLCMHNIGSYLGMDDFQLGPPLVCTDSSNPLQPCSPDHSPTHAQTQDTPCSRHMPMREGDAIGIKRQHERCSGSEDELEANSSGGGGGNGGGHFAKKQRLVWTPELHSRFLNAVNHLGIRNAVPKTILALMNVEGMTRENVASHLQKYRLYLKKLAGYGPNEKVSADVLQHAQEQASRQVLCGMLVHQGASFGMGAEADEAGVMLHQTLDALLGNVGSVFTAPTGFPPGPVSGSSWTTSPFHATGVGYIPPTPLDTTLQHPHAPYQRFATAPAAAGLHSPVSRDTGGTLDMDTSPITTRDLQYPPWLPVSLVANPLSFAAYGPMARPFDSQVTQPLAPPSFPSDMVVPSLAPTSAAPSYPSSALTAVPADRHVQGMMIPQAVFPAAPAMLSVFAGHRDVLCGRQATYAAPPASS